MDDRFELFTTLITRISRNIRKIKNQEMSDYELRSSHVSCLYYLYACGELTATDLCERCEDDKATVSRALDFLEQNGYIICRCEQAKRYKTPLALTDKGVQAGKTIAAKIDDVLRTLNERFSEEERTTFYRCLSIISDSLDSVSKGSEFVCSCADSTHREKDDTL